jgi:hypothetical protein
MISRTKGSSRVKSSGRNGRGDRSLLIAIVIFRILFRSRIRIIPSKTSETFASEAVQRLDSAARWFPEICGERYHVSAKLKTLSLQMANWLL